MRSRLQWAGLVERMADELFEEGRRRRGRPRLRGEEEDWKKTRNTEEGGKDYQMRR